MTSRASFQLKHVVSPRERKKELMNCFEESYLLEGHLEILINLILEFEHTRKLWNFEIDETFGERHLSEVAPQYEEQTKLEWLFLCCFQKPKEDEFFDRDHKQIRNLTEKLLSPNSFFQFYVDKHANIVAAQTCYFITKNQIEILENNKNWIEFNVWKTWPRPIASFPSPLHSLEIHRPYYVEIRVPIGTFLKTYHQSFQKYLHHIKSLPNESQFVRESRKNLPYNFVFSSSNLHKEFEKWKNYLPNLINCGKEFERLYNKFTGKDEKLKINKDLDKTKINGNQNDVTIYDKNIKFPMEHHSKKIKYSLPAVGEQEIDFTKYIFIKLNQGRKRTLEETTKEEKSHFNKRLKVVD